MQERIAEFYDEILVYGHRTVFDPIATYQFPAEARSQTHFCGYVANREQRPDPDETQWPGGDAKRPVVLATAGGGEDGFFMLENFIRAATGASWQGVMVAGPLMPDGQLMTLQKLAV